MYQDFINQYEDTINVFAAIVKERAFAVYKQIGTGSQLPCL